MRLRGKVVIVAGAGGGMGTAIPALFAREGARLLLVARRAQPLEELAERIRADAGDGVDVAVCAADLTTREGAEAMAAAALERFGRIGVLYNNLGDSAASRLAWIIHQRGSLSGRSTAIYEALQISGALMNNPG